MPATTSDASAALAGPTSAEARSRLARFGPNTVSEKVPPRWLSFLAKFWGPVPWLLEAAMLLQLWLSARIEAGVIGSLLLFNAMLGVVQERRAAAALVRILRGPKAGSGSAMPMRPGGGIIGLVSGLFGKKREGGE
jgi:magnesium-transporting ATPase (P-type)